VAMMTINQIAFCMGYQDDEFFFIKLLTTVSCHIVQPPPGESKKGTSLMM
jgi:hypothetical protein